MDVEPLPPLVEEDDAGFAPPPDDDFEAPGGDDDDDGGAFQPPLEEEEDTTPQDDPWEELDPLANDSKPRPLKRGRTWRAPPEDGDTVELPSHMEGAPSDSQVAALCAAEASATTRVEVIIASTSTPSTRRRGFSRWHSLGSTTLTFRPCFRASIRSTFA